MPIVCSHMHTHAHRSARHKSKRASQGPIGVNSEAIGAEQNPNRLWNELSKERTDSEDEGGAGEEKGWEFLTDLERRQRGGGDESGSDSDDLEDIMAGLRSQAMQVCMCVCVYVCMHVYVCMYVCVYACVCVYVCMCVCMYVCMYVCVLPTCGYPSL
jgi:hypothetical protein